MHTIISNEQLSAEVYRMTFEAPEIARERKPGQFIILQNDTEFGERIPLTIADADAQRGSLTIIFQTVGRTTHRIAMRKPGDTLANVLGPLGQPTHIERYGHVVCIGGGIGAAPLYPIVQGMVAAGNRVSVILGARNKELIILEKEMRALVDDVTICTDDGSYGQKGLVTAPLEAFCAASPKPDMTVAIGPPPMMKFCALTTKKYEVPIIVSLNTIMIDGTGMCGGCRVRVGGRTKFVCVDGPEFDGHQVDFDSMSLRLGAYRTREEADHHQCHLEMEGEIKNNE